jgi:hypothetical protein
VARAGLKQLEAKNDCFSGGFILNLVNEGPPECFELLNWLSSSVIRGHQSVSTRRKTKEIIRVPQEWLKAQLTDFFEIL